MNNRLTKGDINPVSDYVPSKINDIHIPADMFHCEELDNGLKVLYIPIAGVGTVSTNLVYSTGSAVEVQGQRGLAHIVEHMDFKNNIWDMLTRYGANLNATTYLGRTNFISTFPHTKESMYDLLTREAARMMNTNFENLPTEANVVHNEFENSLNSEFMVAHMQLRLVAFMRHPTRWATIGTSDDLPYDDGLQHNITPLAVSEFHQDWYHPKNATLVMVGQFPNLQETKEQVRKIMGSIPSPEHYKKKPYVTEPKQTGMRRFLIQGTNPLLAMGFKGPKGLSKQAIALEVINYIMNDGVNSPFDPLVKKGLVPNIISNWERLEDANLYQIYASGNPAVAEPAIWSILKTWKPSEKEFESAKKAISKSWASQLTGSRNIAQAITEAIARGNALDAWSRVRVLEKMTLEDVHEAMAYFNPISVTVGMSLPIPDLKLPEETAYYGLQEDMPKENNKYVTVQKVDAKNGSYYIRPDSGVHLRMYVPSASPLLASMLTKDTSSMSEHEFRTYMRGNGAQMDASEEIYGGYSFSFDYPNPENNLKEFKKSFELFLDSIHNPGYEDFNKNKSLLLGKIGSQSQNTNMMAANTFYSMLLPNGMQSVEDAMKIVSTSGMGELKMAHGKMFEQGCKITAFAPNQDVVDILKEKLDSIPAASQKTFETKALDSLNKDIHLPKMASTTVMMGKVVDIGTADEEWMPLNVATQLIGGTFTDELMQIVRKERGLTYGVNSRLAPLNEHQSLFQIVATFAPEKLERGISSIHEVLDNFKSSLNESMVLVKAKEMDAEQLVLADNPVDILNRMHKNSIGSFTYDTARSVELRHVQDVVDKLNWKEGLLTVKVGTF